MVSTGKILLIFLMIVLINVIQAKFSDVPPPPKRPERFYSREELKRYLQKVHEYHSIVGRWRLRRRHFPESSSSSDFNDEFLDYIIHSLDQLIKDSNIAQQSTVKNPHEQSQDYQYNQLYSNTF